MNEMNFIEAYQKYRDEIIYHTMELVKINSVLVENEIVDGKKYRFGIGAYKSLQYVLDLGTKMGFVTKDIDGICGHIEYGHGDEIFGVLCHVDVVPAEGSWTNPPFEPVIRDNKIYGRGTSDDKGPAICSLYALKALKDLGIDFNKRIRLIIGTDEETGSRGLARYLEVEQMPTYGISPDADFPIIYGEKGMITFDIVGKNGESIKATGGVRYNVVAPSVKVIIDGDLRKSCKVNLEIDDEIENDVIIIKGKSAHAMEPNNGINAIKRFAQIFREYINVDLVRFINDKLLNTRLKDMGLDITDDEMGDLTMNMGLLSLDSEARLGINIRYPKNLNYSEFINKFIEIAGEYNLHLENVSNSKPHYINPKSEFIQILHDSYLKYTNDYSPLKTIGGGTYARALKNAVAYGVLFPGDKEMAHETDEFIDIDKLMLAGVIITDAIYSMGKYHAS